MKKLVIRIFCFVLLVAMLQTPILALSDLETSANSGSAADLVSAVTTEEGVQFSQVEKQSALLVSEGEKSIDELQNMSVDLDSLPVFIDKSVALEKQHVNRLVLRENNTNVVIYQNKNGTCSNYIFQRPVKYIDSLGNIKDKSNVVTPLSSSQYSYAMLDNSISAFFPKNIQDGMKLTYQNYTITMHPITDSEVAPSFDNNIITYDGVFGDDTALVYETSLYGLKEDIVLYDKIVLTKFAFELNTNLIPFEKEGKWYLKNTQNDVIGSFGEIIILDSSSKKAEGSMNIVPANKRNCYLVTINIPQSFLISPTTVYPVYVDPSTYIEEKTQYYDYDEFGNFIGEGSYDSITDTGLYDTDVALNNATSNTNVIKVGFDSATNSNGKVIYKLYDFFGERGLYKHYRAEQIGTVYLSFYSTLPNAATITAYPMSSSWDSDLLGENPIAVKDTILWNSFSTLNSSSLALGETASRCMLDITQIVRGWADFNQGLSAASYNDPSNGFVLSGPSTKNALLLSTENTNTTANVYVVMDTSAFGGDYYINHVDTGKFLSHQNGTSVSASIYSSTNTSYCTWKIQYIGNNKYIIYGNGNLSLTYDTIGLTLMTATNFSDSFIWNIGLAQGGGITIQNENNDLAIHYNGSTIGLSQMLTAEDENYKDIRWRAMLVSDYVSLSSASVILGNDWIEIGTTTTAQLQKTPSNATWCGTGDFIWSSSDPDVATITNGVITGVGNGYSNIVVTHKLTNLRYSFPIVVGAMIPNGTYQIKNMGSGKYMDVEGPTTAEGGIIQQWSYHTYTQGKWELVYAGAGYYYIRSVYSSKYVKPTSESIGTTIVQTDTPSDACKWKITRTPNGNYKFISKLAESAGRALCLPITGFDYDGTNLTLRTYTNNTNFYDEWFLYYDAVVLARRDEDGAPRNSCIGYMNVIVDNMEDSYSSYFSYDEIDTYLENSKLFIIHTHGNTNIFKIQDGSTHFTAERLKNLDLSKNRLVVFLTCSAGDRGYSTYFVNSNNPRNLVEAAICADSETSLGFSDSIFTYYSDIWLRDLFVIMQDGTKTLQEAVEELNDGDVQFNLQDFETGYEMSDVCVIGGNSSITLNDILE